MQCKRRPFHLFLGKATKARPRLSSECATTEIIACEYFTCRTPRQSEIFKNSQRWYVQLRTFAECLLTTRKEESRSVTARSESRWRAGCFNKLDRPINAIDARDPAPHEYQVLSAIDHIVRAFRLGSAVSGEHLEEISNRIRPMTSWHMALPCHTNKAIVVRETTGQIAQAASTHQRTGTLNCRPAFS